ncbi:MAG: hypothetical protein KatS3mg075_503 [Meiothermus sp.]|nr:MAG: hypothetical protein KatS3mg075_503 [Meiothermus sp.]
MEQDNQLGNAMSPEWNPRALLIPEPVLVPEPPLGVLPPGRESYHHLAGEVRGKRVYYGDLNAYAWYVGRATGYLTANRGRKGLCRTFRGAEDGKKRQG